MRKLLGIALLLASSSVRAATYVVDQVPVPNAQKVLVSAINNTADVAGIWFGFGPNGGVHGFVRQAGSVTSIDVPGATATRANGINDAGVVVGKYFNSSGTHAFLYDHGSFRTLDLPGSTNDVALDINDRGEVLISADGLSSGTYFVLSGDRATPLPLRDPSVGLEGFNNKGTFVGSAEIFPQFSSGGVIFANGQLRKDVVATDQTRNTAFLGVSDLGVVAGSADDVPFLYANGTFTYLRLFHGMQAFAAGINDAGQVAGSFSVGDPFDPNGRIFGYVATPVPEPRSWCWMVVLIALCACRYRMSVKLRADE